MKKPTLLKSWDNLRQANGIVLRVIAALPADRLDMPPIPNMRTPKELVVHLYNGVLKELAEGTVRGSMTFDRTRETEKKLAASLESPEALVRFARDCWNAADQAVRSLTDAQIEAEVKTPFGNHKGTEMLKILNDEFMHHRGQLYAYARVLGIEPPMLYDFANNEPAFQPQARATV